MKKRYGLVLATGIMGAKRTGRFLLTGAAIFLSILTIQQNRVWESNFTLYQYTLQHHSTDPDIHYNLGNAYLRRDMLGETEREYQTVLLLQPDYQPAINNLGIVLEKNGQTQKAYDLYVRASSLGTQEDYSRRNMIRLAESLGFSVSSVYATEIASVFDHSLFGELLKKHVSNGWVDYRGLQKDRGILDKYLSLIATVEPGTLRTMSVNEQIAFYVNTYNALTIKAILDNYPVNSIRDIRGVWDKDKYVVARKPMTLDHLEHDILRKQFREPRIHFAIVCASKSCARLRSEVYTGKNLSTQLDEQTRDFIRDFRKNRFEKTKRILYLSNYFRWFSEDFGDVPTFVARYLRGEDARLVLNGKIRIKYLPYDWTLNEK